MASSSTQYWSYVGQGGNGLVVLDVRMPRNGLLQFMTFFQAMVGLDSAVVQTIQPGREAGTEDNCKFLSHLSSRIGARFSKLILSCATRTAVDPRQMILDHCPTQTTAAMSLTPSTRSLPTTFLRRRRARPLLSRVKTRLKPAIHPWRMQDETNADTPHSQHLK